jgi:hypothetical protein
VVLVELPDAVSPLSRLRDAETLSFEQGAQELADVRLVLDDQHGDVAVSHQLATVLGKVAIGVEKVTPSRFAKPLVNRGFVTPFSDIAPSEVPRRHLLWQIISPHGPTTDHPRRPGPTRIDLKPADQLVEMPGRWCGGVASALVEV